MKRVEWLNTSAGRIARVYTIMLVGIALAMSTIMIAVVGTYFLNAQKSQASSMMSGLKNSFIVDKDDWKWWRIAHPVNRHTTYVRIVVKDDEKQTQTFLSPNTAKFLGKDVKSWPIFSRLQYRENKGFYYHVTSTDNQNFRNYHDSPEIRYELWVSMNGLFDLLLTLIQWILFVTLACLIIGTILIFSLAKRLNRPLVELTDDTKKINQVRRVTSYQKIPVPNTPTEVHDLSIEFNRLLDTVNDQVLADRQFVSDASHELKTPIAGIRGHVELIKRRGADHPEIVEKSLQFIDTETKRMQRMIENLLKLSRYNQNQLLLETTDLSRLVASGVRLYQNQIPQRIVTEIDPNVTMTIHQDSLREILVSLLANASKYAPADSRITVALTHHAQKIILSIADEGPGISAEDKQLIFRRFYRSEEASTTEGSGLGLAIVKQLVELNNGIISVVDNQPTGAKFVITFVDNSDKIS